MPKWQNEGTMRAVLVRHGETDHNANDIFQGYAPVPLSARGRQQAVLVAERLVSLRPQMLYSSDLRRAQETADIISQRLGLPVQPCEGLREWNVGTWIGKPTADYLAHLQELGAHPVTHVPEGGRIPVVYASAHRGTDARAGRATCRRDDRVCESWQGHRSPYASCSGVGRHEAPSISHRQHLGEHFQLPRRRVGSRDPE
jgi:broad specificity phosphatase PhoE